MPFYHFDLVNSRTEADIGSEELSDDIAAMDSADGIARRLLVERPELKSRHYLILVTNQDGEEVCRVSLETLH